MIQQGQAALISKYDLAELKCLISRVAIHNKAFVYLFKTQYRTSIENHPCKSEPTGWPTKIYVFVLCWAYSISLPVYYIVR